jgi:hypothetical protein
MRALVRLGLVACCLFLVTTPNLGAIVIAPERRDNRFQSTDEATTGTSSGNWWDRALLLTSEASGPFNETIARALHAEVLTRSGTVEDGHFFVPVLNFAHKLAAHVTAFTADYSYTGDLMDLRTYYAKLPSNKKWSFPNGTILTDPLQAAMRDINGGIVGCPHGICPVTGWGGIQVFMTSLNPGFVQYMKDMFQLGASNGLDGFYLDSALPDFMFGGGFDPWTKSGFQQYLATVFTPQQLKALGITNLTAFDHGVYFKSKGFTDKNSDWKDDPIWRAFTTFEVKTYFNNIRALADAAHNFGSDHMFYVNGGNTPDEYWIPMLSSYEDVLQIETGYGVYTGWGYRLPGPVQSWLKLWYSAAALGQKSAWSTMTVSYSGMLNAGLIQSELLKFLVAETYSSGVLPEIPFMLSPCENNVCYTAGYLSEPRYHEILAGAQNYTAFVENHRSLLTGTARNSGVALIYSVPTMMWNVAGPSFRYGYTGWNYAGWNYLSAMVGYGIGLERSHIPYDVLAFVHPQFMNDSITLDLLSKYDVIVLPNVEDISKAELATLRSFVQNGGTIVVVGVRPAYDENHNPLSATDNSWLLGEGQRHYGMGTIVGLSSSVDENKNEASRYFNAVMANRTDLANLNTLINAVNVGYKRGLQITAPGFLVVDSFGQPNRQILHLLNYNYNVTASNIQVSWKLPTGFVPGSLMVESPDNPSDVQLQYAINNGWLQFTVPSLSIWDMVILNLGGTTVARRTTSTASTSASSTTSTSASSTSLAVSPGLPNSTIVAFVAAAALLITGAIIVRNRQRSKRTREA